MPSFADALNRNMEDIKRPPPPPIGHYIMRVSKMPDAPAKITGKDGTNYERLDFPIQIVAPTEDIDPEEIAIFGDVSGVNLRMSFLFNTTDDNRYEQTLVQLKQFLAKLGIDAETGTLSMRLAEAVGCQFIGELTHRPDPKDANIMYPEIGRTASV